MGKLLRAVKPSSRIITGPAVKEKGKLPATSERMLQSLSPILAPADLGPRRFRQKMDFFIRNTKGLTPKERQVLLQRLNGAEFKTIAGGLQITWQRAQYLEKNGIGKIFRKWMPMPKVKKK